MKQIIRPYILLLMTMFVASCTSEIPEEILPDTLTECEEGVIGIMPEPIDGNNFAGSRNAFAYNYSSKKMIFSWTEGTSIGVFMKGSGENAGQQVFSILYTTVNGLSARFTSPLEAEMKTDKEYMSYSHYDPSFNPSKATSYPVSFDDQRAENNSKMYYYFAKEYDNFTIAEKNASSHLDGYDYLIASATPSTVTHLNLNFSRMQSIIRFYLKSPAAEKYDSLQLVVVDKENPIPLIIKGKLNMETGVITGDEDGCVKNRVQTLQFNRDGFDMTISGYRDGQPTYPNSEYYNKESGYIVTYMMMAPVDLRTADKVFLYLISSDDEGNKNYYKSGDLDKPNLTPNMFYQWTYGNKYTDEPIEFQPVTVQVWENDVLNNDGKGTEGW